jgi:hypothetical protein
MAMSGSKSARPRSLLDPDFAITSPLLKPGLSCFAALRATSFCVATSSADARRRRPAARPRGSATGALGVARTARVRPRPLGALGVGRFTSVDWSARSLSEAVRIAFKTDDTNMDARRSSSVRRVPMNAAYRTSSNFCKCFLAMGSRFSDASVARRPPPDSERQAAGESNPVLSHVSALHNHSTPTAARRRRGTAKWKWVRLAVPPLRRSNQRVTISELVARRTGRSPTAPVGLGGADRRARRRQPQGGTRIVAPPGLEPGRLSRDGGF